MSNQRAQYEGNQIPLPRLLAASNDFAFIAIISIIVANAAGVIGLVIVLGSVWGTQVAAEMTAPAAWSLKLLCLGLLAAMVSSTAGYIAQSFYGWGGRLPSGSILRGICAGMGIYAHCMALLAAAVGIIGFAWGVWEGTTVFSLKFFR